jgi:hypothetical protein
MTTPTESRLPRPRLRSLAGAVPGALLGAVFGAAAAVRRTKPLHPRGRVGSGVLEVTVPRPELGVPLLAATGEHPVTARWSRSVGLPEPLPDVEGFAVRILEPTADLLFSATGTGRLGRFLLVPRLAGRHGPQGTLLPVATDAGSLLLMVTPLDEAEPPTQWELAVAASGSRWQPVGTIRVEWGDDQPLRFDPVEHQLPGTSQYPAVARLREPAYLAARLGAEARV